MKSFYSSSRKIRYRAPAPSVCFGVGAWMVAARQSSWGKGAAAGEEARRGRITIPDEIADRRSQIAGGQL